MSPIDWAKLPLQKYAEFTGRAPRPEYWWFVLAMLVAAIVVRMAEYMLGLDGMVAGTYGPLSLLVALATLVPSLAVAVRRLHDSNRSGWWLLLLVPYTVATTLAVRAASAGNASELESVGAFGLVGFACAILLLVLLALPGTSGPNRFGSDPQEAPRPA